LALKRLDGGRRPAGEAGATPLESRLSRLGRALPGACWRSRAFECRAYRQSGTAEIDRRRPKMQPTFFGGARGRRRKTYRPQRSVGPIMNPAISCSTGVADRALRGYPPRSPSFALEKAEPRSPPRALRLQRLSPIGDRRN